MKTIKQCLIARFSEYCESGVSYSICDEHMKEYYIESGEVKYICDLEIPEIDRSEVVDMGVAKIDKEIVDLQVQITQKEAKKKQLLAIEHKGNSDE